ncbi:MAG: vanadium-dependent haloperoxidase [Firmicutes bacterium]|nr:vanadium-dependent haloperoxidase [Bacillota bacterium]
MSNDTASTPEKEVSRDCSLNTSFSPQQNCAIGPTGDRQRNQDAFAIREEAALFQKDLPIPGHPCNGDEDLFPNKIASFSKVLPHNQLGEVILDAYRSLIRALSTANPDEFETIDLGGIVKLANPQASYAFNLAGPDSHKTTMIPAPAFSSAEMASEMAEVYWQALTRDVPFADYGTNPLTLAAASELSNFSVFLGPKVNGQVTPGTLFRGNVPGDLTGPYVSQFLLQDFPFGAKTINQRYRVPVAGIDFMTTFDEWLNIQNGFPPTGKLEFEPELRFIRNGRDLGEYVHQCFPYQAALTAGLILLGFGNLALAQTNPYLSCPTQVGFVTFGIAHILDFVARASRLALEAAWFQKWLVHRRLRPEEFGGRVQNVLTGAASYPIDPELLNSQAVAEVFSKFGTYLLPQAYPEGCPVHPSYPAGHASFAGAGITMLKAFFKESLIIPNPVEASPDGLTLLPYTGAPLTVGGELNKLASNISIGRDTAGVHYRSDALGLMLGETAAIGILQDYKNTYNEDFIGFSFTKFDGNKVII